MENMENPVETLALVFAVVFAFWLFRAAHRFFVFKSYQMHLSKLSDNDLLTELSNARMRANTETITIEELEKFGKIDDEVKRRKLQI